MIMVQRLHAAIARPAPARRGIQLRLPFKTWPPVRISFYDEEDERHGGHPLSPSHVKEVGHAMFPL